MKESYGKEPATPTDPESCGAAREGVAEALTEERAVATSTLRSGVNPDRTNRQQNPVHNNGAKTSPRVSLTRDNSSDRAWGTYRNGLRDDCRDCFDDVAGIRYEQLLVRLHAQDRRVRDRESASCRFTLSASVWPICGARFIHGHAYPPAYS